ncbi:MAG: hypothetical protein JNM45_08575 [Rhizobiales bacterium]|nr:hypothetical protein [Hyphomicrobiales bacterium]
MKLVFTVKELAEALQISTDEFNSQRLALEANGFPRPLPELAERWSIMDVVNWVNGTSRGSRSDEKVRPVPTPMLMQ